MVKNWKFETAVALVLKNEGGISADKDDRGGFTKYGISSRFHPDVDIVNLTKDGAKEIYWAKYWAPNKYASIKNESLAAKVMDLAVVCGPHRANRWLKMACNECGAGIVADGKIGPWTLSAVNDRDPVRLMVLFLRYARAYFEKIATGRQKKFLHGWLNRVFSI